MSHKKIIAAIIIFLIISFGYLSFVCQKKLASAHWWSLSFVNPTGENINFAIDNRGSKKDFHWEVLSGQEMLGKGDIVVEKNSVWQSQLQIKISQEKKALVRVSSKDEKKEIYKNF